MTRAELPADRQLTGGAEFVAVTPRSAPEPTSSATELTNAYRACRELAAEHGRTYFLATRLLAAERRPAVHALYAFARIVDDIVDYLPGQPNIGEVPGLPHSEPGTRRRMFNAEHRAAPADSCGPDRRPADELDLIEKQLRIALEHRPAALIEQHPTRQLRAKVLLALADTIDRYAIAPQHFWTFLDSMRMDLPGTAQFRDRYRTMAELRTYMSGSAAAIGLQLLPVLGTVVPRAEAEPPAAALGEAFQLTNFLRDIAEDLDRGRIYLPTDDLAAFEVDEHLLAHCRRTGTTDRRVRRALAHLIAVNRDLYRTANPGINLLDPRVRPAIRTASTLYAGILDRIEDSDYAVFRTRAVVPRHHRLRVAATEFTTSALSR